MAFRQLIAPKLTTTDNSGWCLRFVGNDYQLKNRPHPDAWDAWTKAKKRHTDALPTDVAVPVFFTWTGTIDGVRKNWGDVAIHVPGRGVFGTPLSGAGKTNRWDSSVHARASAIGGSAQYVGWTEDLNGYQLVEFYNPVDPRDQQIKDLQAQVTALKKEADKVPTLVTQVETLTKQLSDNDKAHAKAIGDLQADLNDKMDEVAALILNNEDLQTQVTELNKVIEIKEKEIKRLEANQVEGSPWDRLLQAIKDLLKGVKS